jgi:hypothetical protein
MGTVAVHSPSREDAEVLARVAAAVQGLGTLRALLAWGRAASREGQPIDVVTQDEFTHDVVFEWTGGRFLAFDTT